MAERLAKDASFLNRGIEVTPHFGEGTSLMAHWEGADLVVIVDAMKSKSPVGTVRRFEALREKLGTGMFHYSSHLFGLAEAVEMARVLGQLPKELIIYGIEGASFAFGAPLSPAVAAVLPEVEAKVRREFERG